jgi:hypothetical protein
MAQKDRFYSPESPPVTKSGNVLLCEFGFFEVSYAGISNDDLPRQARDDG